LSSKRRKLNSGDSFGRLNVMSDLSERRVENGWEVDKYTCQCICGEIVKVCKFSLIKGYTKSCGCLRKGEKKWMHTHEMTDTRQYKIWGSMKVRCDVIENQAYPDYGGRGISYDPKWKRFESFWEDMQEGYLDTLTLERIDVNSGYCKENCRWATKKEQCRNKRKCKNNSSGVTGVAYDKRAKAWKATWSDKDSIPRTKNFPVRRHGEE